MQMNRSQWGWLLASSLVMAACSKSSSEDTEKSVETGKLELMPAIDVSCGGSNCFGDASGLHLQGESFLQSMRMFTWVVVGPPASVFSQFTTAQQDLITNAGLVGRIEGIRKSVTDAAQAYYTGDKALTSCADAPTSGSFTVDTLEVTWTTPILSAPAGNETTGKYEKAVTATVDGTDYRFEFNCDKPSMAVAAHKGTDFYQAFFYEVDSKDVMHAEFDLWSPTPLISSAEMMLQLIMTRNKDNDIQVWTSRTGVNDSDATAHLGYRYAISKAGNADPISFFNVGYGDSNGANPSDFVYANWKAASQVTSDAVTATKYRSNASGSDETQGCAANWDAQDATLTSADLCTGLTLNKAPASGLDANSNGSMLWIDTNVPSKLKAIFP